MLQASRVLCANSALQNESLGAVLNSVVKRQCVVFFYCSMCGYEQIHSVLFIGLHHHAGVVIKTDVYKCVCPKKNIATSRNLN